MRRLGLSLGGLLALAGGVGLLAGCQGGGGGKGGGGGRTVQAGATPATLLAFGGDGEKGGGGGSVSVSAAGAIRGGARSAKLRITAPKGPSNDAFDASGDFDVDLDGSAVDLEPETGRFTAEGDIVIPAGKTLAISRDGGADIESRQGSIFVFGTVTSERSDNDGSLLIFETENGAVVVEGRIEAAANAGSAGKGGEIRIFSPMVFAGKNAILDASGGSPAQGFGGAGGKLKAEEKFRIGSTNVPKGFFFEDGSLVDVRGGDGTAGGGKGGHFEVRLDSEDVDLALLGDIDASGGNATTSGSGGNGGTSPGIDVKTNGSCAVGGVLDVSGGKSAGDAGGEGGRIGLFAGGDLTLLGEVVIADMAGGDAADGRGGKGGVFQALTNQFGLAWVGDLRCNAGTSSTDFEGSDGGEITLRAFGVQSNLTVTGNLRTFGGDAGATSGGDGGNGGRVFLFTADGFLRAEGDIDTHGGSAGIEGSGGDGGEVDLLVDDLDPDTDPSADLEFFGNRGGSLFYQGDIDTQGGDATRGGNGGRVVMDCDSNDDENRLQGRGRLGARTAITTTGGDGSVSNGDGGDVFLRGSDGSGSRTSSEGFDENGATIVTDAGSGSGTAGRDGVLTLD